MKRFKPTSKRSKVVLGVLLSALVVGAVGTIATHHGAMGRYGFDHFSAGGECDRKSAQYLSKRGVGSQDYSHHGGMTNGQYGMMGQMGGNHSAMMGQMGGNHSAMMAQMGDHHSAMMGQMGGNHSAMMGQMGGNHSAMMGQMGGNHSAMMGQMGGYHSNVESCEVERMTIGQMPRDEAHAAFIQQESMDSHHEGNEAGMYSDGQPEAIENGDDN